MDLISRRISERSPDRPNVFTNEKVYGFNASDDDYGMKSKASKGVKTLSTLPSSQRKNNFCSSEAHAII